MSEWQPIETAPKDGSEVILFFPTYTASPVGTYRFDCNGPDGWESLTGWGDVDGEDAPTHWMPLPKPPEAS